MKRTQNEKILQIKLETLIVGIDVGKETHYARAFDFRGLELAKLFRFSNTRQGYEALENWMQRIMKEHGKTEAIVGFEPTGHYWFTLGDHLQRQGHRLGIVNPFHVKCTKELDDNSPTKNDRKDPKTIAMLVKDGRCGIPTAEIKKTHAVLFSLSETTKLPAIMHYPGNRLDQIKMKNLET